MKFISWNVNGLRACLKKGFEDVFNTLDADFFCIQETKMQPGQADFAPEGYTEYIYSADKKGYSGTAIWAREPALSVRYGLDEDIHNHEGRAITLEYPDFYLVNLYVPNSQNELARIDYRMQWEDDLRRYLQKLDAEKPVILCGDLNVAHEDIDLKNPGPNRGAAGFSDLSAVSWASCWRRASRIPSAICTPTPPVCTAGGVCASARGNATRAGASTIFWSVTALPTKSRTPRS